MGGNYLRRNILFIQAILSVFLWYQIQIADFYFFAFYLILNGIFMFYNAFNLKRKYLAIFFIVFATAIIIFSLMILNKKFSLFF